MKIIDFRKKGNLVRFFLGEDDEMEYWGDDWGDAPYECNAGEVYSNYRRAYRDIVFPMDYAVLEPKDTPETNSRWSKEDMKNRKAPCIVALRAPDWNVEDNFDKMTLNNKAVRFYFGDIMQPSTRTEVWTGAEQEF